MEQQGIITGIDNIITPEIDAVIYEYIINRNAIIDGLSLYRKDDSGYALTAGTCIFDGYRGVLEQNIDITDGAYLYAKFVLNFDDTKKDEFYIVTSDLEINTTDFVNGAGEYYMLLYAEWGQSLNPQASVSNVKYPYISEYSEKTRYLTTVIYPDGTEHLPIIGATATTPTADVNAHIDNPYRVANTEYVHNQIQEELAISSVEVPIYESKGEDTNQLGSLTLFRRGQVVWGTATVGYSKYMQPTITFTLPEGYIPTEDTNILIVSGYTFYETAPPTYRLVSYPIHAGQNTYISGEESFVASVGLSIVNQLFPIGYKA